MYFNIRAFFKFLWGVCIPFLFHGFCPTCQLRKVYAIRTLSLSKFAQKKYSVSMLDVMSQPQSVTKGENQFEMQNIFIFEINHLNVNSFMVTT